MGRLVPWINLLKAWLGITLDQGIEICPNPIGRQPFEILRGSPEKEWFALISICDPSFLVVSSQKVEMK